MSKLLLALCLVFFVYSQDCFADFCVIQGGGSCVMNTGGLPAGSPCYCQSAWGPLPGRVFATNQKPLPNYCCTAAGRLGPYSNSSIPLGSQCIVPTPMGQLVGQACY